MSKKALGAFDAFPQSSLERIILADGVNMARDCSPNHFGYGLILDAGHCLELIGLLFRKANCHCFLPAHECQFATKPPSRSTTEEPWYHGINKPIHLRSEHD